MLIKSSFEYISWMKSYIYFLWTLICFAGKNTVTLGLKTVHARKSALISQFGSLSSFKRSDLQGRFRTVNAAKDMNIGNVYNLLTNMEKMWDKYGLGWVRGGCQLLCTHQQSTLLSPLLLPNSCTYFCWYVVCSWKKVNINGDTYWIDVVLQQSTLLSPLLLPSRPLNGHIHIAYVCSCTYVCWYVCSWKKVNINVDMLTCWEDVVFLCAIFVLL